MSSLAQASGYMVREEYPFGGGKTVELHGTKQTETIIIEIETARAICRQRLLSCKGYPGGACSS
jgi:hypothetical protein